MSGSILLDFITFRARSWSLGAASLTEGNRLAAAMAPTPIKNVRLTPPICGPLDERRMNGAFRSVSGGIQHRHLMNSETDYSIYLMTTIDFPGPATSKTRKILRIIGRRPRMSPRGTYSADHIIVDDHPVFRRRIERHVSPVITVHGFHL